MSKAPVIKLTNNINPCDTVMKLINIINHFDSHQTISILVTEVPVIKLKTISILVTEAPVINYKSL